MKKLSENVDKFSSNIKYLQQMLNKVNPDVKVNETGVWGDKGIRDFLSVNKKKNTDSFPCFDRSRFCHFKLERHI